MNDKVDSIREGLAKDGVQHVSEASVDSDEALVAADRELTRRRDIADRAIAEDARRAGMTNTQFRVDTTKDKVDSIREGLIKDGIDPEQLTLAL